VCSLLALDDQGEGEIKWKFEKSATSWLDKALLFSSIHHFILKSANAQRTGQLSSSWLGLRWWPESPPGWGSQEFHWQHACSVFSPSSGRPRETGWEDEGMVGVDWCEVFVINSGIFGYTQFNCMHQWPDAASWVVMLKKKRGRWHSRDQSSSGSHCHHLPGSTGGQGSVSVIIGLGSFNLKRQFNSAEGTRIGSWKSTGRCGTNSISLMIHRNGPVCFFSVSYCSVCHSPTAKLCHSSMRPGTSLHVTQFYQAFPHVNIASDKCWVRRPGYEAISWGIQWIPRSE